MRIIERFVKNDTPYLGRLVLRFEKNTDYKSTKKGFFLITVEKVLVISCCNLNIDNYIYSCIDNIVVQKMNRIVSYGF
jgi:hypothetical protein